MISMDHIAQQLRGLWAMAFNQPDWQNKLDRNPQAVIASFWVVIPVFIIAMFRAIYTDPIMIASLGEINPESKMVLPVPGAWLLVSFLALFFGWLLTLGLLIRITRRLEGDKAVSTIIVGYNWLQVPLRIGTFIPVVIFILTDSPALLTLTSLPVLGLVFAMVWGVLRQSLPRADWTVIVGILISLVLALMLAVVLAGFVASLFYSQSALAPA